ncbi:anaerobic dimethyl sulfoxide reductase subunit B (iron-sulfur subunit) [Desulfohalotomaculum tongense]|uniref:DMSO/selenate family reductase complex B subunit n=1 Tax=Desulforadius tongensis TaxID=1216062 RepID=UPI00195EECB2|nr:DMSO/selenate family reductase complex B subunit [Desulforadius tongensis]MBM7854110.1 anaerobic dimethyl sulfoxide reductase subunit B (iron-sulfur subunit) [Desulforadius tongensis]
MGQKGFYFDMTICIGCKTCQVACKDKNELPVEVLFRKVRTFEGGKYPKPWVYHLSMSCNHCAEPKCVKNCPTGALYKRKDGIVAHNRERCIGCQYCVWSCPYGAPNYLEEEGKSGKCDMCADLIDKGKNPACVDACMMRALHFGDLEELKAKYGGTSNIKVLPDSGITKPSILINPKPIAKKGV